MIVGRRRLARIAAALAASLFFFLSSALGWQRIRDTIFLLRSLHHWSGHATLATTMRPKHKQTTSDTDIRSGTNGACGS